MKQVQSSTPADIPVDIFNLFNSANLLLSLLSVKFFLILICLLFVAIIILVNSQTSLQKKE